MYLIDTDHMSLIQRGGEESDRILERIRLVPRDDIAVTVLSFEEQMRGWLAQIAQQKEASSQVRAYGELKHLLQSYCFIAIIDFDVRAATEFERLRTVYRRHGAMDLKIAAIALAQDATVITRNARDFSEIIGLRWEDWTR